MSTQRIQPLDQTLINQIAAGEVIERPASAVKELLENSFDAGATAITVHLEKGGMQYIEVLDNGTGIVKDDLALALCRHATSKIRTSEDLSQVLTLGFRGEALAAMSAVSQLTLTSHHLEAEHAWQLHVSGGQISTTNPAALAPGTRVQIHELFYNTPARRRFLKSEQTELAHCVDVCQRFVLSSLSTHLTLYSGNRRLHDWPASGIDPTARIKSILGESFLKSAAPIAGELGPLHLHGFITRPTHPPSQPQAYFYINGRFIRDRVLQHAIKLAYSTIGFERTPFSYVLYLTMKANDVDVNVHPAKLEVRLHDNRLVHDFITREIIAGLQSTFVSSKPDVTRFVAQPTRKLDANFRLQAPPLNFRVIETSHSSFVEQEQPAINLSLPISSIKRTEFGLPLCLLGQRLLVTQPMTQDGLIFIDLPLAQQLILEAELKNIQDQTMERLAIPLLLHCNNESLRNFLHTVGLPFEVHSAQEWLLRQCANCWLMIDLKTCLTELLANPALWQTWIKDANQFSESFISHSLKFLKSFTRIKECQPLLSRLNTFSLETLQEEKIVRQVSLNTLAELI